MFNYTKTEVLPTALFLRALCWYIKQPKCLSIMYLYVFGIYAYRLSYLPFLWKESKFNVDREKCLSSIENTEQA